MDQWTRCVIFSLIWPHETWVNIAKKEKNKCDQELKDKRRFIIKVAATFFFGIIGIIVALK
jgi:hypothetical protein